MAYKKRPDFFIVGAPKCGTTALNDYLAEHPNIFVARKEMHFFGSDLNFGPHFQLYRHFPKDYRAAFDAWDGQSRAGEASVWYLFSEKAAEEIKAYNPDARIIIMLREPTSLLYSLYCQFVADGNEHLATFNEALAAETDRRARRRITRQTYLAQALVYRETACFSQQVRRYFDAFGRERVQVILFDDFSARTSEIYHQTLEFLGVAPAGVPAKFTVINGNVNGNDSVRSTVVRAVLNDRSVRRGAVALRACLPRRLFNVIKSAGLALNESNFNHRSGTRQPIEPELQQLLREELAPEVERLSLLLNRDLTHWSKPERILQSGNPSANIQPQPNLLNETRLEAT